MKRPLSDFSDAEVEEVRTRAKRQATSPPPSTLAAYNTLYEQSDYFKELISDAFCNIDRAFDLGIHPRKGKYTKVEFLLLRSLAASILFAPLATAGIVPKTLLSTRFSHAKQSTVIEVRLTWKIQSMDVAKTLLGDRLERRPYADPNGTVNFDPANGEQLSGGYLSPIITPAQPLILHYLWDVQGVQLELYVEKLQATRANDGTVEFRVTAI